ncbi:hypothetical protein [Roseovarius confluentis]
MVWAISTSFQVAKLTSSAATAAIEHGKKIKSLKAAHATKTASLKAKNRAKISKLKTQHRVKVFALRQKERAKRTVQWALQQGALTTASVLHSLRLSDLRIRNRARVNDAVLKAKAKARLQRYILAVPVAGAIALLYFEDQDYAEWKEANPEGTLEEYGCLIYAAGKGMVSELQNDANRLVDAAYEKAPGWVPDWLRVNVPDLANALPPCADPQDALAMNE